MTPEERMLAAEKYGGRTETSAFARDCARLRGGEPLAYVIGHQPFLGLTLFLDSKPLIPRPETEWWTEKLLCAVGHQRGGTSNMQFLDLCAGSGAIGCAALAALPNAQVYFGEVDPAHEATIRKNIRANGLDESRAHIGIGDLFLPFGDLAFDVIAANPPYIPEKRALARSVEDFEPALALRSGEDGLDMIRRIARELPRRLRKEGVASVECDSAHAERAQQLFGEAGLCARIIPDQYGAPRVIAVSLPS